MIRVEWILDEALR